MNLHLKSANMKRILFIGRQSMNADEEWLTQIATIQMEQLRKVPGLKSIQKEWNEHFLNSNPHTGKNLIIFGSAMDI